MKMLKGALVLLLLHLAVAPIFLLVSTSAHEEVEGNGLKDDKHLFFFKPRFIHGGLLHKKKWLGFKYGPFGRGFHGLGRRGFGPFGGLFGGGIFPSSNYKEGVDGGRH